MTKGKRGAKVHVYANTPIGTKEQDGSAAKPFASIHKAFASVSESGVIIRPTSEREAVRTAITGKPFDVSHVDPLEAYRWGAATGKRLERRSKRAKK